MANSDISVPSVDHRQEPSLHTNILDIRRCSLSISYLRSILAPILGHQMEHVSKIDRRTTKHGARFRITVPEPTTKHSSSASSAKASKPTGVWQNYRRRRPDQPRPTAPPPTTSRHILAGQCCQHQQKRPAIRHIVRKHQALGHLRDLHHFSKFRFTSLDSMSFSIQPRDLDAEELP
ncbi:hypothetical protein BASA83_006938 [Batrachochytrium salamandrivorans]|nr:hypothetical protein BASA83_006938 [Batrachochytrium salamandrivorans]